MPVKVISGNIFTSTCQTLVNTVNCEGVMGAGLALEFRLRRPDLYAEYQQRCARHDIEVGKLWLDTRESPWVLNFPTKKHWRHPSRPEYLRRGLQTFCERWSGLGITSVAFPLLGASSGGLDPDISLRIMLEHLRELPLRVEVYRHSASAPDDLYDRFRTWFLRADPQAVASSTGLSASRILLVRNALEGHAIRQMNQLAGVRGIGLLTLERLFRVASERTGERNGPSQEPEQGRLPL